MTKSVHLFLYILYVIADWQSKHLHKMIFFPSEMYFYWSSGSLIVLGVLILAVSLTNQEVWDYLFHLGQLFTCVFIIP